MRWSPDWEGNARARSRPRLRSRSASAWSVASRAFSSRNRAARVSGVCWARDATSQMPSISSISPNVTPTPSTRARSARWTSSVKLAQIDLPGSGQESHDHPAVPRRRVAGRMVLMRAAFNATRTEGGTPRSLLIGSMPSSDLCSATGALVCEQLDEATAWRDSWRCSSEGRMLAILQLNKTADFFPLYQRNRFKVDQYVILVNFEVNDLHARRYASSVALRATARYETSCRVDRLEDVSIINYNAILGRCKRGRLRQQQGPTIMTSWDRVPGPALLLPAAPHDSP